MLSKKNKKKIIGKLTESFPFSTGSSAAVLCVVLTLAQCASRFSTAGSFHTPEALTFRTKTN